MDNLTVNFGKGAIRTPTSIKANHFRLAAELPRIIDWSRPYMVEDGFILTQRNQNGSLSCTAQATCYYTELLEKIENKKDERYSARFNYSQSYIAPDGGAYIWKAMSISQPGKPGLASAISVPDGDSTEAIMRDASLNAKAIIEARSDKYAVISNDNDIDHLAGIIQDYHGFITGFNGWNGMFAPDGTIIDWSRSDWGHAVFVCGFEIRNGKKCLRFKNSWTAQWGDNGYGYFPEDFIKSGMMFDAYVYAILTDIDPNSLPPTPPSTFSYNFTKDLFYGQTSLEIKALQKALKIDGEFPINQTETGFYGNVTATAVMAFQKKYNVASLWEINLLHGRKVGQKTRMALNNLFNK